MSTNQQISQRSYLAEIKEILLDVYLVCVYQVHDVAFVPQFTGILSWQEVQRCGPDSKIVTKRREKNSYFLHGFCSG